MPAETKPERVEPDKVDVRAAQLAAEQWSVLDVTDLRRCGLSADAIAWRAANGRLFAKYRGVYSVIPNLSLEGEFLAAVKACGPDAVLSHFSAAVLWGWFDWDCRFPEVTTTNLRDHRGIYSHQSAYIERVIYKGIPVTPPARTVIDLSGKLPYAGVRRAVNEGLNRGQLQPSQLVTSKHRGAAKLRKILATAAPTRNEYEDVVLAILLEAGLPKPDVNVRQGRYFPDFRWSAHQVILEADSRRYHGHLLARADDAARQAILEAQGETVLRTTWWEIVTRPGAVTERVRAALTWSETKLGRALADHPWSRGA
jgi:very-short-patch-repair endonuclease